jgi:hypothetical protein
MIPKNIDQVNEKDLQALVENSVLERKTIEYKQSLPSDSDSDKKEFLADVSSFANASGGDLIYGIIQNKENGTPERLEGLDIKNPDQEILRLENLIRNGIEPRIPSFNIRPIPLSNSRIAIIIRVNKSWISPHRVSFKGHDKFYSRGSNGKYPLNVEELRIAFTLSETLIDKIKKFRENRISAVYAGETPVPLYDGAKIILHLIPIISFNPAQHYDIDKIASQPGKIAPIYCMSYNCRYNLDGFLTYSAGRSEKSHSYVQLFRNGIIEAVEALMLNSRTGELLIPSGAFEKELIISLSGYLSILQTLNVELPIFIFLTLVGVKGYSMAIDRMRYFGYEPYKIDRDVLFLPEVIIESYDVNAADVLKPCFDSVWNACGFPRSLNYDNTGKWNPKA